MRCVKVPLGDRSYSILIGPGLLTSLGQRCRRLGLGRRCALITDRWVGKRYACSAQDSLTQAGFDCCTVVVPPGEKSKRLEIAGRCYDQMARHRLDRASFIVALGGGVVGDLAGFVAATYLRGVALVQVPTTLLAQVDSSVGGKVAVNLAAGKNLVGAFHQPRLVLCDLDTLQTLPEREFKTGLAEVIKYGIIHDAAFFRRLEREMPALLRQDPDTLAAVVARCCAIKGWVVGQDETETGLRAILNFGHTIGHAIENSAGYGKYRHGEAISIGQVAAARLSQRLLGLPENDVTRIRELLERAGLPVSLRLSADGMRRLLDAMKLDKKVAAGEVKFVLARCIGEVLWGMKVPQAMVEETLQAG